MAAAAAPSLMNISTRSNHLLLFSENYFTNYSKYGTNKHAASYSDMHLHEYGIGPAGMEWTKAMM
jgi:hypothetical protein